MSCPNCASINIQVSETNQGLYECLDCGALFNSSGEQIIPDDLAMFASYAYLNLEGLWL